MEAKTIIGIAWALVACFYLGLMNPGEKRERVFYACMIISQIWLTS